MSLVSETKITHVCVDLRRVNVYSSRRHLNKYIDKVLPLSSS